MIHWRFLRDLVQHFYEYIIDVVKGCSFQSERDALSLCRNKTLEKVERDPNYKTHLPRRCS